MIAAGAFDETIAGAISGVAKQSLGAANVDDARRPRPPPWLGTD
jgi:hypothetical protein